MFKMRSVLCSGVLALVAAATTLGLVTTAYAAAPSVRTTGTHTTTPNGITLVGTVDPNKERTQFYFEYGKTRRYGSRTEPGDAGSGDRARRFTQRVEGLEPNTLYHFRIVASNRSGVTSGSDKTFRTKKQPLALQITVAPNPVAFGDPSTVSGTLTGTGNANREIDLQQRAFPFTVDFAKVGNTVLTDGAGNFSFPVLPLPVTTQFRVRTTDNRVYSPVVTLGVAARVRTTVSRSTVRRNRRVRFSGTLRPSKVGVPFEIQKQTRRGEWVVVRRGLTRAGGDDTYARYSKRVRVPRTARYRVFVGTAGGDILPGFGPEMTVRVKRR